MANVDNLVETTSLIQEIKDAYNEFVAGNGCEPKYAEVKIKWYDDSFVSDNIETIVVNGCDVLDNDEDILFYCNSVNGLIALTNDASIADFLVVEFFGFYN